MKIFILLTVYCEDKSSSIARYVKNISIKAIHNGKVFSLTAK